MSRRKVDTRVHSSLVFDGLKQTPSRAMLRAVGYTDRDFRKPQVGVASTWSNLTPCNMHIDRLAAAAAAGADGAGAKSTVFGTITVSDGISMGTPGMRYSLVSREVIADSIETAVGAQGFDGLVAIGGCDKNMPGCMMAIARLNRPAVFVYGGTIRPGAGKRDIVSVFEAVGAHAQGAINDRELREVERTLDSRAGQLRRHVHGQHDGVGDRSAGNEPGEQLGAGSRFACQARRRRAGRARGRQPDQARHQAVRHPDARGVRERDHREHRAGRLDERRAAPAGDRACRQRAAGARRLHAHRQPAYRCWPTCGRAGCTRCPISSGSAVSSR